MKTNIITKSKVEISASIMCIDWLHAAKQLKVLEDQSIDYLHWDVIDGRFAPDFTMGSSIINKFRANSSRPSDYHLMVEEPSHLFDYFSITPGDIFSVHQECCRNLHRDLLSLRQKGARVGVALNPATPGSAIEDLISFLDIVMVMTVNPGFGGQSFIPSSIEKIRRIRALASELGCSPRIEVDGGVKADESAQESVRAGATILVAGSAIYNHQETVLDAMARLRGCIDGIKLEP